MTIWDMIMGAEQEKLRFTKEDWAKLGRGEIEDSDLIDKMLADGYENIVEED